MLRRHSSPVIASEAKQSMGTHRLVETFAALANDGIVSSAPYQRIGEGARSTRMTPANAPQAQNVPQRPHEGEREAFERLAEPYRRALRLHCYRMLGSLHEAEDLVQETYLRAWSGREEYEGRGSFRGWLYRIATNACLNTLAGRRRVLRLLPEQFGPPAEALPTDMAAAEIAWLEPFPDGGFDDFADTAPGPDARYETREAVRLAFIAAIQHLPPRQRAALILCDVMGWSADETARLLEASPASVNSALQRARAALAKRFPVGRPQTRPTPDEAQRGLLDRYLRAWESADLDRFVALLRDDAVYSMPPWREWYFGREPIRTFFAWAWSHYGGFRLVPTFANQQPAFAVYSHGKTGGEWRAHSIQVLTLEDGAIAAVTTFRDRKLFAAFGLTNVLTS
jgi:RNA polymerase sigma-70 factor (ECF subfamily)